MGANEQTFRVLSVAQPKHINDLIAVMITLQNMLGEKKEERIVFSDMSSAWQFYLTQQKMLNSKEK